MADIGDEQDIQTGLGTFSAHMAQLKDILDYSDGSALVLIDEPGMATDPAEGAAITMAAIDVLSSQGTFVAISTHLNSLKVYGFTNEHAVNAAVEFDSTNNCPSYRLKYGISGISHAIDVARDLNLPQSVIDRANQYLGKDDMQIVTLLEQLNSMLTEAEKEKQQAEKIRKRYLDSIEKTRATVAKLRQKKISLITEKRIEAEHVINEAKREFRQIITSLKNRQSLQANAADRFKDTANTLTTRFKQPDMRADHASGKDIKEGQCVYLKKLNQRGQVLSVDHLGKQATIGFGNMKISAEIKDIEIIENVKRPAKKRDASKENTGTEWYFSPADLELNLIGFRTEEAINLIDKTIDKALVEGKESIKIVHGFGTGKLRKAIRSYLKKIPYVKAVSGADLKSGGDAVTIVKF
jgi:DNA mismatch repair protein MutS2